MEGGRGELKAAWGTKNLTLKQAAPGTGISSESHINGSRTQGVADAPQTFDHYAVHCWECLLPPR